MNDTVSDWAKVPKELNNGFDHVWVGSYLPEPAKTKEEADEFDGMAMSRPCHGLGEVK